MTFCAGSLRQLAHRDRVGSASDELFDFKLNLARINIEVLKDVGRDAGFFLDEPQQQMLGADVFVVQPPGL